MKLPLFSFLACSLALGIGCSDDGASMAVSTSGDDGGGTNITGQPPPTTSPPPTGGADDADGTAGDDGGSGTPTDDTGPVDPDASTGPGQTDEGTTAEPPATDGGSTTGEPATDDTVYEVQDGTIPPDSMVAIENVIVTGVGAAGVFVQEPAGGEYSGVWVYSNAGGGGPDLSVLGLGDEINITGVTAEYFDRTEIEISDGELVVVAKGGPVPTPETLAAAVFGNAAMAEPWEGVRVRVEGAITVTDLDPEGQPTAEEFMVEVDGASVLIDDFLYNLVEDGAADFPGFDLGAGFTAIQGPMNYSFESFKIAPSEPADFEGYTQP